MNLKLLKTTSVYTFLGFIPLLSSFLLLPVYTRFLSTNDYGVVTLSTIMDSYFFTIVLFGLHGAITRFYFDYSDSESNKIKLLSNIITCIVGLCVVIGIGLFFLGDFIFDFVCDGKLPFEQFGWFIFFNALFLSINQILFQYFRVSENLVKVVLITLLPFFGTTIGGVIGVVVFEMGAFGSVAGKSLGLIVGSLPLYFFVLNKIRPDFDWDLIRRVYLYSLPIVLVVFLGNLSQTVDKFIINEFFDLSTLGVYNFAAIIITPVSILIQSYWNSVSPTMFNALSSDPTKTTGSLFSFFEGLLLIAIVGIWGMIMFSDPVIRILTDKSFHAASFYVPVLLLSMFGRAYCTIYNFNLVFYKKTAWLPAMNITGLVIGGGASYLLGKFLGIWGVIIGVLISNFIQAITAYFIERSLGFVVFPLRKYSHYVLITLLAVGANYLFIYERFTNLALVNAIEGILFFAFLVYSNRELIFATTFEIKRYFVNRS